MIFVQLISFKAYHDLERLYNKQVDIEIIYNRKSQGRTDYECASVMADVHRVLIYLSVLPSFVYIISNTVLRSILKG